MPQIESTRGQILLGLRERVATASFERRKTGFGEAMTLGIEDPTARITEVSASDTALAEHGGAYDNGKEVRSDE